MVIEAAPIEQKSLRTKRIPSSKKKHLVAALIATQGKLFVQTSLPERFPFPLDFRNTLDYTRALVKWNKHREGFFGRAMEVLNPQVISGLSIPAGLGMEIYYPNNMLFELRVQHRPKDKRAKWIDISAGIKLEESGDLDFRTVAVISRPRRQFSLLPGAKGTDSYISNFTNINL